MAGMDEEQMNTIFTRAGESFAQAFATVQGVNGNPGSKEKLYKLRAWKCSELRTREFYGDWTYLLDVFLDSVDLRDKVWERVTSENGKK